MEMPTKFTRETLDKILADILETVRIESDNVKYFVEYLWESNTQNVDSLYDLLDALYVTIVDIETHGYEDALQTAEGSLVYTCDILEYFTDNYHECIDQYEGDLSEGLSDAIWRAVIIHRANAEYSEYVEVQDALQNRLDSLKSELS